MSDTHLFLLNIGDDLSLHLLGASGEDGSGQVIHDRNVWQLLWNPSDASFYWTHDLDNPMGDIPTDTSNIHSCLQVIFSLIAK